MIAGTHRVNWGSLDQQLLARMMDENASLARAEGTARGDDRAMMHERAALAELAESYGLPGDHILLSAKVSGVQDLVDVYRDWPHAASILCISA